MPFFNDVGKKITQTGQETVQKAKNTTETIKLNGLINDEKQHIDTELLQIGKLYYETCGGQPELPFTQYVESINAANVRIAEYERQVAQLKSFVCCPVCGNESPYGISVCGSCGSMMDDNVSVLEDTSSPVPVPVAKTAETDIVCNSCGESVSPGKAFCKHCGNKIEQSPASKMVDKKTYNEKSEETIKIEPDIDLYAEYKKACDLGNRAESIGELTQVVNMFTNLEDYKESKKLAEHYKRQLKELTDAFSLQFGAFN